MPHFSSEDEGSMFLRNLVGLYSQNTMVKQPRRPTTMLTMLWKIQIRIALKKTGEIRTNENLKKK
jgi:hypothetical protein